MDNLKQPDGEILLYQTDDGLTRIDVTLINENIWLTQAQISDLFQKDKRTISWHIRKIFEEGELAEVSVVRKYQTTAADGKEYWTNYYDLDVIISVGYRVKSHRGTQFRKWATQRLREYLIKGFAMDDERLKQAGGGNYFDELLARIRDIRSSEKMFWGKVLEIYATSIDYDKNIEITKKFFKVVQNKMHWAAHGHTAAELIYERVDARKPNVGLTSWPGAKPTKADVETAKNFLSAEEIDILNRLVTMYLDFAELQAKSGKPMYMKDWIKKLDDFIHLNEREILTHAGKITHEMAKEKAHAELEKFRTLTLNQPSPVEMHFLEAIDAAKNLEKAHKKQNMQTRTKKE